MVLRTPRTMPVNSSGLRASAPAGGGGPAGGRSRSGARGRRREDGLGLEMKRWRKDVLMLLYTGNSLSACPLVDG